MPPNPDCHNAAAPSNEYLAGCCRNAEANCCKDGYLFLTREEFQNLNQYCHAVKSELQEFQERITDCGAYALYDQRTRCQFLDSNDHCRLHDLGLKPTECFWWPAHVYLAKTGDLEIRVATCCSGCGMLTSNCEHIQRVVEQARAIGLNTLKAFRRRITYGEEYRVVSPLLE